jgi:ATP-dependent Clp protease protease subunit
MSDTTQKSLSDQRLEAEVRKTEALADQAEMNLQARKATRWEAREYLLDGPLTFDSFLALVTSLDDWRRIDKNRETKKVRLVLNSYTKGIIQPLGLNDFIRWMRLEGFEVTVEVAGQAGGQMAVPLQAADIRLLSDRSWLSVSEVCGFVEGNTYEAQEELAWVRRLQAQQRQILCSRAKNLTAKKIKSRSKLKNWHLSSGDAVNAGLADGVAKQRPANLIAPLKVEVSESKAATLKERLTAAEVRKMRAEGELEEMEARDRKGRASRNGVVRFFGPVRTESCARAKADLLDAVRLSDKDITLTINSNGGSCIDGFGFIDLAKQVQDSGRVINTEVLGYAASMGGVMLQLGKKRTMGKNSWLLIHRVSNWFEGTTSEFALTLEHSMDIQRQCFELLASRSVFTADQILERCRTADWWLTAEEALKYGFIDEIR